MPENKKIIIDEDWKSQVRAEKEALEREQPTAASEGTAEDPPMPPASLEILLSSLATEAMIALGQMPHPQTQAVSYHPNQAKYLIDTIKVLQDKTKGNLTPVEERAIENLLHQLRMTFVAVQSGGAVEQSGSVVEP